MNEVLVCSTLLTWHIRSTSSYGFRTVPPRCETKSNVSRCGSLLKSTFVPIVSLFTILYKILLFVGRFCNHTRP